MKRLPYLLERNHNSLDFIRFCAAVAVIFTHSFPYSLGNAHQFDDPMTQVTAGLYTSGQLAVVVFFVISGFLVTASMDRSRNALTYVKARLLRIYPGLLGVILVTIFIVGPVFTTLSLNDYFRHPKTFGYFGMLLIFDPTVYNLPGVFATDALPSLLNGSLWTLFFELLCYGLVLVLWCARLWRKRLILGVWIVFVVALFFAQDVNRQIVSLDPTVRSISSFFAYGGWAWTILWLAVPFCSGMVCYFYRDRIPMKGSIALVGVVLFLFFRLVMNGTGLATLWMPTFGVYILFYLATLQGSPFRHFGRYGDFSYGMYIYAPLVHQSVTYFYGGSMEPALNFVLTAVITLIPAILSWHLVEKPGLKLKNLSLKWHVKAAAPVAARV